MNKYFQPKAPYILAVVISFFLYQSYLVLNSFSAIHNITIVVLDRIQTRGLLWPLFWYSSEILGEIGLLLRFVGACFLLFTAWILLRKKEILYSHLRKAVLLEATHFLFYIPFVIYLFVNPLSSIRSVEAAISYAIQIVLVFPSFFMLYARLKKRDANTEKNNVAKWVAIAISCYVFALWVKHFMFNLYAIGINLQNPILLIGFINSTATLLIAAIATLAIFLPVIREKTRYFSSKAVGGVLICIGAYFITFVLISLANTTYLSFLALTELWAIATPILGLSFIAQENSYGATFKSALPQVFLNSLISIRMVVLSAYGCSENGQKWHFVSVRISKL